MYTIAEARKPRRRHTKAGAKCTKAQAAPRPCFDFRKRGKTQYAPASRRSVTLPPARYRLIAAGAGFAMPAPFPRFPPRLAAPPLHCQCTARKPKREGKGEASPGAHFRTFYRPSPLPGLRPLPSFRVIVTAVAGLPVSGLAYHIKHKSGGGAFQRA